MNTCNTPGLASFMETSRLYFHVDLDEETSGNCDTPHYFDAKEDDARCFAQACA